MVKLSCGVYGDEACFLLVDIQLSDYVQTQQVAIANKYKKMYLVTLAAGKLQLYFAGTKDGDKTTWLADDDNMENFLRGEVDKNYTKMSPLKTLHYKDYFTEDFQPQDDEIHVLVDISKALASIPPQNPPNQLVHDVKVTIREEYDDKIADELKVFRQSSLFLLACYSPYPKLSEDVSHFASISGAFEKYVLLDDPAATKDETLVLNSKSSFYQHGKFWTYGFLRALLDYCCRAKLENGCMIRMNEVTLNVAKCSRLDVSKVI
ncbi:unnamed protein product [Aphanomyces euteiches]